MSKSNAFEIDVLKLILNGTAIANLADNAASSPLTDLWMAFHTADPTDTGEQGTSEAPYTGYTRIAVTRSTAGFVVSTGDGTANPVSEVTFPQATSTSTGTLTHCSVGASSGSTSGKILWSGAITPNLNYGLSVTPILTTATVISED